MGKPLEDEDIDEILDTYQRVGSINQTYQADEVGVSKATVSKYVNAWKDGELPEDYDGAYANTDPEPLDSVDVERTPSERADANASEPASPGERAMQNKLPSQQENDPTPEGYTAPTLSEPDEETDDEPSYSEMDKGDFIEWFFDRPGFGVRGQFSHTLAEVCRVRDELPNEAEMASRIKESSSGIGKDADAEMIAETYWAAAKNYMRENGEGIHGQTNRDYVGGDWVGSDDPMFAGDGGQRSGAGGGWTSGPNGGNGGVRQQYPNQPQGQNPYGQRGNGRSFNDPQNDEVRKELDELKESVKTLAQSMRYQQQEQGNAQEKTRTIKQQMEEFQSLMQIMEQMKDDGDDGPSDAVKQEIRKMQEELRAAREQSQGDDGGNGEMGEMQVLAQLAMQDDMDAEKLSAFAGLFGNTDPDVRVAELEVEKEERKLQNRRQTIDSVFEGLQDVSGDLIGAVMSQMGGGGDDDDDTPDPAAHQPRQPQNGGQGGVPQAQPSHQTDNSGGLTVVGENTGGGPTAADQNDGLSPQARRHANRMRETQAQPEPEPQQPPVQDEPEMEFRGPGDDSGGSLGDVAAEAVKPGDDEAEE